MNSKILLTDGEMAMIEAVHTEDEWNNVCKVVKKVRGGQYPEDWFMRIIVSGIAARITARFGADADLHFGSIGKNGEFKEDGVIKTGLQN